MNVYFSRNLCILYSVLLACFSFNWSQELSHGSVSISDSRVDYAVLIKVLVLVLLRWSLYINLGLEVCSLGLGVEQPNYQSRSKDYWDYDEFAAR